MSAESEVIHAVIEGDEETVLGLLADFLPGELDQFRQQLVRTITMVDRTREAQRRRKPFHPADTGTVDGIRPHRPMSQEGADLQRRAYDAMLADTGEINILRGLE